jgi:hypothetical protein
VRPLSPEKKEFLSKLLNLLSQECLQYSLSCFVFETESLHSLASNSWWSFCLSLPSAGITVMCHYPWLSFFFFKEMGSHYVTYTVPDSWTEAVLLPQSPE